jgi:hypothetical protein
VSIPEDYKVAFGRLARTLVYEDAAGKLLFSPGTTAEKQPGKQSTIYLEKGALIEVNGKHLIHRGNTEFERERLAEALERVSQYVTSYGYVVLLV